MCYCSCSLGRMEGSKVGWDEECRLPERHAGPSLRDPSPVTFKARARHRSWAGLLQEDTVHHWQASFIRAGGGVFWMRRIVGPVQACGHSGRVQTTPRCLLAPRPCVVGAPEREASGVWSGALGVGGARAGGRLSSEGRLTALLHGPSHGGRALVREVVHLHDWTGRQCFAGCKAGPRLTGEVYPSGGWGGWGGGSEAKEKVCVPKIGLQSRAPLINPIVFLRKNFLMWVGRWVRRRSPARRS